VRRVMAALIFWSAAALTFYAWAGYPLLLWALASITNRTVVKKRVSPTVTFIITAYNEELRLPGKIDNTLAQDYPASRFEVIVASDCSTDRTDDIAREYSGVRLVRAGERRGKEAAQQLALEAASGEIIVFSDVATTLAPAAVSSIVANFADPTVGCVSSVDRFVDAQGRVSGEGAYVRYEMWLRALETRVHSLVGLSGSFFAARREVCRRWSADRQSDFSTALNAVDLGLRAVLDPETAGYYCDITDDRRERGRKTRTVVRGLAVLARNLRMLNPFRYGLFAWQLASHKLCRWLVPMAMIGAAVANIALLSHSWVYVATFGVQVAFYAAAAIGAWTGAPALRIPSFLVLSHAAILIAWCRFARGERMTCWTPSRRLATMPQINPR
jgi:glycosyltransferase involved in cell wall biosynthesis